jgi:hypothetical protein
MFTFGARRRHICLYYSKGHVTLFTCDVTITRAGPSEEANRGRSD